MDFAVQSQCFQPGVYPIGDRTAVGADLFP